MAPPPGAKPPPPVPHVDVKKELPEASRPPLVKPVHKKRGVPRVAIIAGVGVIVLAGGFAAWQFLGDSSPPPAPAPVTKAPAAAAPTTPTAAPSASSGPTPSATLNAAAKAPAAAINKAQSVIAARNASGQVDLDPILDGDAVANRPAVAAPTTKASAPGTKATTAVTTLAPGVGATAPLDATPEASPGFRAFVANAKINSVLERPARMFINDRLAQQGDTIDYGLGIVFAGIDAEKRLVIFKDASGAIVSRKY